MFIIFKAINRCQKYLKTFIVNKRGNKFVKIIIAAQENFNNSWRSTYQNYLDPPICNKLINFKSLIWKFNREKICLLINLCNIIRNRMNNKTWSKLKFKKIKGLK